MPNEPAWPARPEPSSYAHTGVGGKSGCSRRRISLWMKEYWPGPLGVATTMPLPGTGTGSRNFLSPVRACPRWEPSSTAARPRCAVGLTSAAPAPMLYCRNCLRDLSAITLTHSADHPTRERQRHEPLRQAPLGLPDGGALPRFLCVSSMTLPLIRRAAPRFAQGPMVLG